VGQYNTHEAEWNVQFFFKYLNSEEADNVPACLACTLGQLETWRRRDEVLDDPSAFLDISGGKPILGVQQVSHRHR
jgi:hypothetical protein